MIKIKELTTLPPNGTIEEEIRKETKKLAKKISKLAYKLQAEKKQALLVVFQGMDASGKDGSTKAAFGYCPPLGVSVHSFKKPTDLEFAHDFLWRVHQQVPAKGEIKIFNRSHYEDILIQRVHHWIDDDRVDVRFDAINAFETLLEKDNNTKVLKFFLNVSEKRQLQKLQERIDDPEKQWKHNDGDWEERKLWTAYMDAYEDVLNRSKIAWIPVPADKRWYRNYIVSKRIYAALKLMDPKLPELKSDKFGNEKS